MSRETTKTLHQTPSKRTSPSRRDVMLGVAGLTLSFAIGANDDAGAEAGHAEQIGKKFGVWVNIAPDGTITIFSPVVEMGQGSTTSLPLSLAEELDADWSKVKVLPAPPNDDDYGSGNFDFMMYTADSNAMFSYYMQLRRVGARVRRVLLDNAAAKLKVPVRELTTEFSTVSHAGSARKLTYGEIAAFAEVPSELPKVTDGQLKKRPQFKLITKDILRLDLPGKVNGTAQFSIDVQVPNMLYGAVLRTPVEGSVPEQIDETKAKAVRGVVNIVRMPWGVGVLAESPWAAIRGRRALEQSVTWSRTGWAWDFDSDRGIGNFAVCAKNLQAGESEWKNEGDAKEFIKNIKDPALKFEAEYRCDYAYHAQLEPLNAVASVSPQGDAVEIWCGAQSQTIACEVTAKFLGIKREKVKLNNMLLGGGFGRRGNRDADFILDAVLLSKLAGRPVKVIWTREDDLRNGKFRPMSAHYLRAGLDSYGKLAAWHHRIAVDRVKPEFDLARYQLGGGRDTIAMRGADLVDYEVPHQLIEQLYRDTGVRTAPLRGIGFNANKFATESFLDEIAQRLGVDPIAYRLAMITDPDSTEARAVINEVSKMAKWGRKLEGRALGFAYAEYGSRGKSPGGANKGTKCAGIAEVSLDAKTGKIRVHEVWCAVDCGIAVQPDNVVAQIEGSIIHGLGLALTETISVRDGKVSQSNFDGYQIPRMNEIPEIHVTVMDTINESPRSPPVGVGQVATPMVAPAIANAVARLANVRLRHTPFTPARVREALSTTDEAAATSPRCKLS